MLTLQNFEVVGKVAMCSCVVFLQRVGHEPCGDAQGCASG